MKRELRSQRDDTRLSFQTLLYQWGELLLFLSVFPALGIACHALLPLSEPTQEETSNSWLCEAEIYRTLPGSTVEFTEQWRFYAWPRVCEDTLQVCESDSDCPGEDNDCKASSFSTAQAAFYCGDRLSNDYIAHHMAPGFTWLVRDQSVQTAAGLSEATDCPYVPGPATFGGPLGAGVAVDNPPASEVYVAAAQFAPNLCSESFEPCQTSTSCEGDEICMPFTGKCDSDGDFCNADGDCPTGQSCTLLNNIVPSDPTQPLVKRVEVEFAERTGYGESDGSTYVYRRGEPHARLSRVFVSFNDFEIGIVDGTISDFYLQTVGTGIGPFSGAPKYVVGNGPTESAKWYLYGDGTVTVDGSQESDFTSMCFLPQSNLGFTPQQTDPSAFSLNVQGAPVVAGADLFFNVTMNLPKARFVRHQPTLTVALAAEFLSSTSKQVTLESSVISDLDGDLDKTRLLWFEDFEAGTETFLGLGTFDEGKQVARLENVPFDYGEHEITLVAYDQGGAYGVATSTLEVVNDPPVADDDAYSVKEDQLLSVPALGVLANDSDANGDPLTALQLTNPTHGGVVLNADGSFDYQPVANYFGPDSFTYAASDGVLQSDPATVSITVVERPYDEEQQECTDLVTATAALGAGQKNSLEKILAQSTAAWTKGNPNTVCNVLNALTNHLQSLVDTNVLTAQEAQPLFDCFAQLESDQQCSTP